MSANIPVHVGLVLQDPLDIQVTVADPDRKYSLVQLYITVPPTVVLVGVPGDPLVMEGGDPQPIVVL